jgi:protein kinase C substrate 80K-H
MAFYRSFSAWDKLADGSNNYSQMQFSGGSTCWNGPSRSMKLLFECGDQDALLTVDEPEKCTYTARFSTPAVCHAETANKLRAELTDDLPVRDEL